MAQLADIKAGIAQMSKIALSMWQRTHQAFMEHNLDLFPPILKEEDRLNDMEKQITAELITLGQSTSSKEGKTAATVYADIIGDLELIGDYCKDILERVQMKVEEKLLFSDDAVKEYNELYNKATDALEEVVLALEKDKPAFVKEVLKSQEHIDGLVDKYRQHHNERLLNGVCLPLACNMFLNMLDFTAAVYYHTKKIAKNILKLKDK